MKKSNFIKTILSFASIIVLIVNLTSCKKDKKTPTPTNPPPPANTEEVITTMKLVFTDSATSVIKTFTFEDADGEGGNAGMFLGTNQSDSIISLDANKTYSMEIILLDVTKNPADTISKEVEEEGDEHMLFFNAGNPSGSPYVVNLSGSGIKITYLDLDAGTPARGIGLKTRVKTYAATSPVKHPFTVTLKHQPGSKDGTFAQGETDVEVGFKVMVN